MTLFGRREGCWRYLDMTREPKLSHARPGQKRQHPGSLFPVYEYQKIPPLIGHIPIKISRRQVAAGSKTSLSPHTNLKGSRDFTASQRKLRAEEVHSIKGELSLIKAQVDALLESLNRMDQQQVQPTGSKEGKSFKGLAGVDVSCPAGELAQRKSGPESDGHTIPQDADSAEDSTDTKEAARNHTSDPEGSK